MAQRCRGVHIKALHHGLSVQFPENVLASIPAISLQAFEEALKALGKANACNASDTVRAHIGRAVVAIDDALQYAEAAAFELTEQKTLPN